MSTFTSGWFLGFVAVALVHLVLNALDLMPWAMLTKIMLAPLLAAWVVSIGGPPLLVAALVGCFFGDLFLELEADIWFLAGMGAFAIAQIFFITWFVQSGALQRLGERWWIAPLVLAAFAVVVVIIWKGIDPALRIPIPIYGVLLSSMAVLALVTDLRAGIGGLLFLFSDAVIAMRIADVVDGQKAIVGIVIMSTYIAAIWLLTVGITEHEPVDDLAATANTTATDAKWQAE